MAEPYPSAQAVPENPHTGSWSLKIGPETGGRAQTHGKPRANTTYRVGAWGMVSVAGEVGWVGVEYYDIYGNRFTPSVEFTETSYTYKEVEFTTSETIDSMRVFAWKNDGPGYLYVDDFSFVGPDFEFSPGNTTYYVDSIDGDDASTGTSPESAWRTLDKVNSVVFAPGDRIVLKSGCVWNGQLDPMGSGDADNRIILQSDWSGPLPLIDGGGTVTAPFRLFNQEYWMVWGLELINYGTFPRARYGAWVIGEDAGALHSINLSGVEVHDVNGLLDDSHKANGGIIFDIRGLSKETWWNGIFVGGCTVRGVDRSGIWLSSWWWDRSLPAGSPGSWVPSIDVQIMSSSVDDIGGDGIVPTVCDGPLVEYNVAKDCNTRSGRYCVAIWPWACDNAVIQYNEAYLTRGTNDGEGFDSDWFSHNTIIQYNYSHDNEGGFCLICANGTYSGFNDGTIVRYNISQNDLTRAFHIAGPTTNTAVYNNTIYIGEGMSVDPIIHTSWGGYADDTRFYNNIFYDLGSGDYIFALSTNNLFDSNVFFGNHPPGEPDDLHKLTDDPLLAAPGGAGIGRDTCSGYKLQPNSPCIDSGLTIPGAGGLDFWGGTVPSGAAPDRGAHEWRLHPDTRTLTVRATPVSYTEVYVTPADLDGRDWGMTDCAFTYDYDETVTISMPARATFHFFTHWDVDGVTQPGEQSGFATSIAVTMDEDHTVTAHYQLKTFPDVPEDHWAYAPILNCWAGYIVEGYPSGLYSPDRVVTRDQMAVFIARAIGGVPAPPDEPTFPDVPLDHWAYESIEEVAAENIVEGYGEQNYHPEWDVTRGQMAVFGARAIVVPRGEEGLADYEPSPDPTFDDVPSGYWCHRHVEYLAEHSVVEGYSDGLYRPTWRVTRDQMAVYIARGFLG